MGDNPTQISLFSTEFWIQVHDLPCGFMSEKIGKEIGNFIGSYVEADANNYGGIWRNFMRIRVAVDVRRPLKRRMKIKKQGGEWSWIQFKYERLPTFCFFCGIIGHSERFCEKYFDCQERLAELPFGAWLRASSRRESTNIGERWLRNVGPGRVPGTTLPENKQEIRGNEIPCLKEKGKETMSSQRETNGVDIVNNNQERDLRDSCNFKLMEEDKLSESQLNGIIIMDAKRRRMVENNNLQEENMDGVESNTLLLGHANSKNMDMAGTGFQARQTS